MNKRSRRVRSISSVIERGVNTVYSALYKAADRSRSFAYIVDTKMEGIQENVSVAAICPEALQSVQLLVGRKTYHSTQDPTFGRGRPWPRGGLHSCDLCISRQETPEFVCLYGIAKAGTITNQMLSQRRNVLCRLETEEVLSIYLGISDEIE